MEQHQWAGMGVGAGPCTLNVHLRQGHSSCFSCSSGRVHQHLSEQQAAAESDVRFLFPAPYRQQFHCHPRIKFPFYGNITHHKGAIRLPKEETSHVSRNVSTSFFLPEGRNTFAVCKKPLSVFDFCNADKVELGFS